MSRKRRADEEELPSEEEEDDDDSMEDVDEEEEEEEGNNLPLGSPSPGAKKGMMMRSGRRKRRRSKETTGLTPPEVVTAKKKSRKSTTTTSAAAAATANGNSSRQSLPKPRRQSSSVIEINTDDDDDDGGGDQRKRPSTKIRATAAGRDSLLLADHGALAAAQEPLLSTTSSDAVPSPVNDLFNGRPPSMSSSSARKTSSKKRRESPKRRQEVQENGIRPGDDPPTAAAAAAAATTTTTDSSSGSGIYIRLFFVVLFSFAFMDIWPICVKMTDLVIPLEEVIVEKVTDMPTQENITVEEIVEVVVEDETPTVIISDAILKGVQKLRKARDAAAKATADLNGQKLDLETFMSSMKTQLRVNQKKLKIRYSRLEDAEKALLEALEEPLWSDVWDDARDVMEGLGTAMLETSSLELWHVDDPVVCDKKSVVTTEDPILEAKVLKDGESNLLVRASMTAEKITNSKQVEDNVRAWVRQQIDLAVAKDKASSNALTDLKKPKKAKEVENVEDLIQYRLQLEHADGTGLYDHASRVNGAKVIYGGKRGTTKSLVDSLPLFNRLMQLSRLRFYGYGPEAAITPTYPRHALGQCWSFQQMPVKEQLKRRRLQKDDHKHGNFGTLTISLPDPVYIGKVSIEHPPETFTDNRKTAIRAFRVIGYADEMAEGKAWSLGSFEYDIAGVPLQKFKVASDIFGTPVPKMHSLSLAIDSNWGEDYACLYRVRVHGDDEEEEEEDEYD